MKDKLKKVINPKTLPFIILFLVMLSINILKSTTANDDTWFSKIITGELAPEITNFSEYKEWRYETWSSRILIEFFLIQFTMNLSLLWKLLDAAIYTLLAYGIYKVFCTDEKKNMMRWLIVILVFLIPQKLLASAGWIATTLNYSWVVAFGIICLMPIRKTLEDRKMSWHENILYVLLCIYATNSEQMCLVLLTVYAIFSIYFIAKKKIKPIHVILLLIAVCSLIYILACPGNKARTISETETFFKDFEMLTFVQKLEISAISTMQYYLFEFNIIYVLCTSLLAIKVFQKYPNNFLYKMIVIIPVIFGVAFNALSSITQSVFPDVYNLINNTNSFATWYIDIENFHSIEVYVPLAISIINFAFLVLSVYLAFGNSKKSIIALLCICAGLCTRILMGFMASCYASGNRTHIIFLITMIITSVLNLDEKDEKDLVKYTNLLIPFIVFHFVAYCKLIISVR